MRGSSRTALVVLALAWAGGGALAAQRSGPPGCWTRDPQSSLGQRASHFDSASVALGGRVVKVCYSRPAARGRKVMGGLVPFGQPWRLGANEATAIHVPVPATIAGVAVQPGWYSLYTVPGQREWRIVVNREARRWGVPIDARVRAADLGSGVVPARTTDRPVEALTLRFRPSGASAAELVVEWERTSVRIPVVLRARGNSGARGSPP